MRRLVILWVLVTACGGPLELTSDDEPEPERPEARVDLGSLEDVRALYYNGTPIALELPATVALEITETMPAVKGNSATNVKKNAVVETGMTVKVPMHIGVGEKIKIHTDTGDFLGRAND